MATRLSYFLLVSAFFISCANNAKNKPGTPLARVGDAELTLEELLEELPDIGFAADSAEAFIIFRDRWIEEQLILQEAKRLKLEDNPGLKNKIERAKQQVIINNFQDLVLNLKNSDLEVSTEEAQLYFQEHKNKFLLNERHVRFRHLVAASRANAEQAKSELMRGVSWETVLQKYSIYPNLLMAESEKFVSEGTALNEYRLLNRYLHIIGVTEISPIEKIGKQFHFVQLMEEKAPGEPPDLNWLIPQIQNWLSIEKKRRAFNSYLKNLYLAGQANDEITLYDNLPKTTLSEQTDTLSSN